MDERQDAETIQTLLDRSVPPAIRVSAAHRLAEQAAPGALVALLEVAQDDQADAAVAYAAGGAIALLEQVRGESIDRLLLANFSGAAYRGYDDAVSRRTRGAQ